MITVMIPMVPKAYAASEFVLSFVPPPVTTAFHLFHKAHLCLRIFRQVSFVTAHPYEYLVGQNLYVLARDFSPVKIAAQTLFIIKKALDVLHAQEKVKHAFADFTKHTEFLSVPTQLIEDTIRHYTHVPSIPLPSQCKRDLISLIYRIAILSRYIFAYLTAAVVLSSSIAELVLAMIPTETTIYEGITTIATNAEEIYHVFHQQAPKLYRQMKEHREYIDEVLRHSGIPVSCAIVEMGVQNVIHPLVMTAGKIQTYVRNLVTS